MGTKMVAKWASYRHLATEHRLTWGSILHWLLPSPNICDGAAIAAPAVWVSPPMVLRSAAAVSAVAYMATLLDEDHEQVIQQ